MLLQLLNFLADLQFSLFLQWLAVFFFREILFDLKLVVFLLPKRDLLVHEAPEVTSPVLLVLILLRYRLALICLFVSKRFRLISRCGSLLRWCLAGSARLNFVEQGGVVVVIVIVFVI